MEQIVCLIMIKKTQVTNRLGANSCLIMIKQLGPSHSLKTENATKATKSHAFCSSWRYSACEKVKLGAASQ